MGGILTAFIALERGGDLRRLEQAMASLGRLQYYCEASDPLVAFGDECDMARRYLELQKLRFGERLNFEVPCEGAYRDALVPRFCVLSTARRAAEGDEAAGSASRMSAG